MANDRLRNRDYDSNMASLGGRISRFEQILSEVHESIGTIQAESVVLNMNTCTVVGDSITDFIRGMENTAKKNAVALEDYEWHIFAMTEVHTKSIGDMQAKLHISLAFGFESLCPPGLGTVRYSAIASAWMDVLPRLLPQKESVVESAIFSVSVDSNNGFDLLWRILELAMPGFKSMNPVQVPTWTPQTDVLSFCREHLLYFWLQSKHNMFFSACTQMNIFLRNIQLSEYADVVTTLQSQVNAYLLDDDDGYLPANLCINGIATVIYMNASARARDVGLASPRVRRVAGDWDSTPLPPVPDDELPLCGVQGYRPHVYRVEQGCQDHFRRPYERDGPAGCGGRGFDRDRAGRGQRDFDRDAQHPSPRDWSIRPDLRRRSFLPGVQCKACKLIGHEASSCDMLAIALFLNKYIKMSLTDDTRRTIESTWIARWKEKLGQPQRSPTQVMKAYCNDLDITSGHLDLAMDWECWPEDEYGDFSQDLQIERD